MAEIHSLFMEEEVDPWYKELNRSGFVLFDRIEAEHLGGVHGMAGLVQLTCTNVGERHMPM